MWIYSETYSVPLVYAFVLMSVFCCCIHLAAFLISSWFNFVGYMCLEVYILLDFQILIQVLFIVVPYGPCISTGVSCIISIFILDLIYLIFSLFSQLM